MQFHHVGRLSLSVNRIQLKVWKKWAATFVMLFIVMVAFVIPCFQLSLWSIASLSTEMDHRYIGLLFRSLAFASMAAALITPIGLILAYIQRQNVDIFTRWLIRLSTMGYALPGTILAVGIAMIINKIDKAAIWVLREISGSELSSVFGGSIAAVLFAYTVRFLTVGFNTINSSMLRVTKNMDEASVLMGINGFRLLQRVHIPILKNGLFVAAMLVFVDVMKEMPITLMTRPFGWDTLSVKIFELTSEGEWQRAALPSITLVAAGLLPLILLNKKTEQSML